MKLARPPEKNRDSDPIAPELPLLCSPACVRIIAKYRHVSRISRKGEAEFLCS
jgi:hypothetical protein